MSLAACPKPGSCLDLEARVDKLDDRTSRQEQVLNTLTASCQTMKTDLHAIRVEGTLRNQQADSLTKWFMSLIIVGLLQLCATVWWASNLNATVTMMVAKSTDIETRLRLEERESAARYKP
ncbi:MAG: hypothetical protein ACOYNN_04215 [Terrimicrobiaceae bacterium]